MIYHPQTINFREVNRGDTFHITLEIAPQYPMAGVTRVLMRVHPTGDIPELPVLTFDSDAGSIIINGQEITLHKEPGEMDVRSGRFKHEIQLTKEDKTDTLYWGLFEITQHASIIS